MKFLLRPRRRQTSIFTPLDWKTSQNYCSASPQYRQNQETLRLAAVQENISSYHLVFHMFLSAKLTKLRCRQCSFQRKLKSGPRLKGLRKFRRRMCDFLGQIGPRQSRRRCRKGRWQSEGLLTKSC
jgi:hypothetical protein